MSVTKLAVLLCAVMACAEAAIAQVVWTEPAALANPDDPAAEPYDSAAALGEQAKLLNTAPNTFGLGLTVAIDGDTAVAGAPDWVSTGIQRGAVLVFTRTNGSWQLQQVLQREFEIGFGGSVDISGDTLIVGTVNRSGSPRVAYVYVRTGGTWTHQATLQPDLGASASYSVAIDGNTALVGSFDAAYVFVRSGSTWTQQARLVAPDHGPGDLSWRFGDGGPRSLALDGNTAIIGAKDAPVGGNTSQGAVYVFTRSGVAWSPQAKLTHSPGTAHARLGTVVALSGDNVLAGARRGYVFERSGATWVERPPLEIPAVFSDRDVASLAIDGNTAVLGVPFFLNFLNTPGAAYSFKRQGTSWFFQEQLLASDGNPSTDHLGADVAVASNTVLAGAPDHGGGNGTSFKGPGAVYVFTLSDTLPDQPPGAPILTVSVSGTTVNLSWTPAAGPPALSYIVEAGTASGLFNIFNGNVGSTTQLSAGAPPGTYYLRVRGVNTFGTGAASTERLVTIGAPGAPTLTSAIESGGILTVAWLPGPGGSATSYRLDFYAGGTLLASMAVGATTTVAIPLPAGIRGSFGVRVTAFNGAAAGPASALYAFTIGPPCTPPASPSLSGGIAGGTASVTWTAVADATQYMLSAGTTQGGTQYMPPTNLGTNTSVSASGLPAGFTAWVRVVAVNGCGQQSAPADLFLR